ncbi:hypothetical protein DFH28DRAFT_993928, partial [Melampsora americana]
MKTGSQLQINFSLLLSTAFGLLMIETVCFSLTLDTVPFKVYYHHLKQVCLINHIPHISSPLFRNDDFFSLRCL